ncbi:DUF1833 domain-containing protein [Rhodobacteraceae bacterium IMCC1335]
MRTTLSTQMLTAAHAESSGEVVLPLVKLTQAGWDDAICIVPNWEPVTHQDDVYEPLAFQMDLPDEEAEGVPVLNWIADNVDRRLVEALRTVSGAVAARIVWVLASSPDHIEVGPFELEMRAAQYDAQQISGTLGVEPILETQFGHLIMNPKNTPALF